MRLAWPSLCLLIGVACYGGGESPPLAPGSGSLDLVDIRGVVTDSVLGRPLAGVALSVGGKVVQTGADGSYAARVPAGPLVVRVQFSLYEDYQVHVPVASEQEVNLRLRRLNPALTACAIGADSIRAVIVDLQGRKTINRAEGSTIRMASVQGGQTDVTAWDWRWTAVDEYTWQAAIAAPDPGVVGAVFTLRDKRGFGELASCTSVPAPQPPPPAPQ